MFITKGYRVFGTVRRQEDADRVRSELGEQFIPLLADVTDEEALRRAADFVRQEIGQTNLAGLVNNAGILIPGPMLTQSREDFEAHFDINVLGVLLTTRAFLPLLGTEHGRKGKGRIINVSSASGKLPSPFCSAYAASKHALEGLNECMRQELMLFGIDVILVVPGSTITPIWDKASVALGEAQGPYAEAIRVLKEQGKQIGTFGYPPERVGEVIFRALTARKPNVRYDVIPYKFLAWTLPRLLPARFVDSFMARNFKLYPDDKSK